MTRSRPFLLALLCCVSAVQAAVSQAPVAHARQGPASARMPRLEGDVRIDGILDEAPWKQAAVLTGFSAYLPLDNRPAADSTEILVWYTPTDLYLGVRAWETHGAVHATLAARDHIDSDDNVQLMLDPFNDRRRAFVFAVNALGVQADGIRSETGSNVQVRGQTFGGSPPTFIDLNPDFYFDSKGHVTDFGYEVEVRIPLKSIRFQGTAVQTWGFQALRFVQHSGYQQTWTQSRRGSSSFLSQSGTLTGIQGLRRDLVAEVNPEVTWSRNGDHTSGVWVHKTDPSAGGNLRWRIVPNVTLNATARPDFSQVEADAAQIPGDTRFSLFFPEKRPFFVDGSEQFETSNNLIYTRRILQPEVAAKVSGKFGRTSLALLSALDTRDASVSGKERPLFNLLRLRRDLLAASGMGFTYTDRTEATDFNRVAAADARFVWGRVYALSLLSAVSSTEHAGVRHDGPDLEAMFTRSGYRVGLLYSIVSVDSAFTAGSGFVPRSDYVRTQAYHRISFYPKSSIVESWLIRQGAEWLWLHDKFYDGNGVQETKIQVENVINVRGGWTISVTPVHETFLFDPRAYRNYARLRSPSTGATLDTLAFSTSPRTGTLVALLRVNTPQYQLLSGRFSGIVGRDVDFFETAPARRLDLTADVDFRPSPQLRLTTSYLYSIYKRSRDGTTFSRARVPRLKAEYQLSRALFVRFVGQYDNRLRDALRDPTTEQPLVIKRNGQYVLAVRETTRDLRVDWLLSFVPSPGTVVFAGYGAGLTEQDAFRFRNLERVRDGFFVKLSYLFRK